MHHSDTHDADRHDADRPGDARRTPGRSLAVAVGFLTRLPTRDVSPVDDEDLRLATAWFPFVGLVVGALGGLARWSLDAPFGPVSASLVAVAVGVMATGAFHEDGWADTFDGLWGGWTPERRIEIMRDSRIGTYGSLALLLAVGLQVSLLAAIDDPRHAAGALVGGHVLGRLGILLQIAVNRPASDQGSGAKVAARLPAWLFTLSTTTAVTAAVVVLAPLHLALPLAALAAMMAATATLGAIARARIGGTTGDVLGATSVAGLTATLACAAAFHRLAG